MEDTTGLGGLLAFVIGWFLAQLGKLIGDLIRNKGRMGFQEIFDCFFRSGGMPSGHTASFTGLTVFLMCKFGIFSAISVLALCMTIIVVYDAVNVRYAVGEQGKVLNVMIMDRNYKKKKVKVVEGHTVPQAIVGAILGIGIGLLMALCF
jgi:acid phosphatase family membrane protein YuiD